MKENRTISVSATLSEGDLHPKDCMIVTKQSSIGRESVKTVVNVLCPEQYTIVDVDDETIDFVMVRKATLKQLTQNELLKYLDRKAKDLLEGTQVAHVKFEIQTKDQFTAEL